MRCDYCYNRDIVFGQGSVTTTEALTWLQQRRRLLDGVVLSGGEATRYPNLTEFAHDIKTLGFNIKLDTNGTCSACVHRLLHDRLIDYVALDYKAPYYKYRQITHHKSMEEFHKTLDLLLSANISFEVRTTLHHDLLDEDDINIIMEDLHVKGYRGTYYLQPFLYDTHTIGQLKCPKKQLDVSRLKTLIAFEIRH